MIFTVKSQLNYILDFFCHELMLGIELDGLSHDLDDVVEKDIKKEKRMNKLGITILRFNDSQVMNDMIQVLRVIEFWIVDFMEGKTVPLQTHPGEIISPIISPPLSRGEKYRP